MDIERTCNDCGSSEWREIVPLKTSYPERRKERERTVRRILECENCGAEGRRFEDGHSGHIQYSGAM
jgi:uncharacterized Zn finger protein